jgi:hypothetical protein
MLYTICYIVVPTGCAKSFLTYLIFNISATDNSANLIFIITIHHWIDYKQAKFHSNRLIRSLAIAFNRHHHYRVAVRKWRGGTNRLFWREIVRHPGRIKSLKWQGLCSHYRRYSIANRSCSEVSEAEIHDDLWDPALITGFCRNQE